MDDRLTEALDQANYAISLENQRKNLRAKYANDLIFCHAGGTFSVTKELISFCAIMSTQEQQDIVLIDDNNNPILIRSLKEFLRTITDVYYRATNSFFTDYDQLRKGRTVGAIT